MVNSTITGCSIQGVVAGFQLNGGGGLFARNGLQMVGSELINNSESGSKYGGGGAAVGLEDTSG